MKIIKYIFLISIFAFSNSNIFANEDFIFENQSHLIHKKDNFISGYNYESNIKTSKYSPYIKASYLLYQPIQKGMSYAFFDNQNANHIDRVKEVDFKLQSGFELNLGLNFSEYDDYNLNFSYLFFRSTVKDTAFSDVNSTILKLKPLWHTNDLLVNASTINAKWDLDLDLIDLKTSRSYYVGKFITLEPSLGIKTGRIYQKFVETIFRLSSINSFQDESKSNSWIIGPTISTNAKWFLNEIFSIKTNLEYALFYQNFKAKHFEQDPANPANLEVNITNDSYDFNSSIKLSFNFEAGKYLKNDNMYLAVNLGYDTLIFFNQNYMRHLKDLFKSYDSKNIGDLHLHGLNLSLSFNF
ncbi:MAG: hypothetical protein K1060chlam5_00782 [Candidatus Anoxychlamydiales bacterium]|nr:hypothetical protein [Candidatus Anoxychlamydiales bacterium]